MPFDWSGDETRHVESRVTHHVEQIGEHARAGGERNEREDRFEFAHTALPCVGEQLLHAGAGRDDEEFGAGTGEVLDVRGHAVQSIEFAADGRAESHVALAQVAAGSGIRRCGHSAQAIAVREGAALRQTVRVGGDDGAGFEDVVTILRVLRGRGGHECVERHIHTDAHERGHVNGVDHHVEIRHHVAFHIVFPGDHAQPLARGHMAQDLRHVGARMQPCVMLAVACKTFSRGDRRLMGECAFGAQIIYVGHWRFLPGITNQRAGRNSMIACSRIEPYSQITPQYRLSHGRVESWKPTMTASPLGQPWAII